MHKIENFGQQVADGERFEFGANWSRFLSRLDDRRINEAVQALKTILCVESLAGMRFLDIGCGSGLFSLAAHRLGATVVSFDFDPKSVACALELRRRENADAANWSVQRGSVLDSAFIASLGSFDVVYSWGVLHHTGEMWTAIDNAQRCVSSGGKLSIAIYNDQGKWSTAWLVVKRIYNRLPRALRWLVTLPVLVQLWGPSMIRDLLKGRPFHTWKSYAKNRGMSPWHDLVDWVGGLPFEVAGPDAIFNFVQSRGFKLTYLKTCGGDLSCNEFTFVKES